MSKNNSRLNNPAYISGKEEKLLCEFLIGYHNPAVDAFMDLNTGKYQHLHRFADNNPAKINSVGLIFDDELAVKQAWIHLVCDWELLPKRTFKLFQKIRSLHFQTINHG